MSTNPIDFQLDRPENSDELTYRPHGVCTIKLKISSATKDQPALRLRVKDILSDDIAGGTFRGFPENNDALMVSWGGGHEPGPCVKPKDFLHFKEDPVELLKGETSYIYFNLTHIKPSDLPESAVLTIEAYNPADNTITSTLTLTLVRPTDIPEKLRLILSDPDDSDIWRIGEGSHLQSYDPRWWPEGVNYAPEARDLPLTIHRQENKLKLYWGDAAKPIIVITDRTEPSILIPGSHQKDYLNSVLFDLFNFDDNHLALRVWFYWLNKHIGGDNFFGRHEVPDAERFDFILRKETGKPIFVCTDLHWSEMWGEVQEPPLEVSLGLSRKKILEEIKKKAQGTADKAFSAPAKWLGLKKEAEEPINEAQEAHNPINFIRLRTAALYKTDELEKVRDKGSEAHVPQMHGVIEYHRSRFGRSKRNQMISNDVRLVF